MAIVGVPYVVLIAFKIKVRTGVSQIELRGPKSRKKL